MYLERAPEERIDRYTGPYERWVFSPELGRPFAFPAISRGDAAYYTALLEGGETLPSAPHLETRKPPLWNPMARPRAVTPFAFHNTRANARHQADTEVAQLLASVRAEQAPGGMRPRFRVNFPVAPEAWTPSYHPECRMEDWVVPDTPPKAIIAVIDDGIPFAHRAFLDAQGRTRMSHVWLQAARAEDHGAVPFGRELMNGNINALRADAGDNEDLVYRNAGAIDASMPELGAHLRRHATHGSHIAGMAAGNDTRLSSHPLGDDIQIIAVQLPNTIAWDTSGFGKEMYMLSALHYVFNRARAISRKYAQDPDNPTELPLVVNFSYGWTASRHDGRSEMELAIQELLEERKSLQPLTAITMPTGNNFTSAMHGQITAADMAQGSYAFGWKLMPDDRTSSYLEMWLPEGMDTTNYTVHVTPPQGHSLSGGGTIEIRSDTRLDAGLRADDHGDPRRFTELEMGGENIGQLSVDKHRNSRWRVLLALVPTVCARGESRRAPSGLWTIELRANSGAALAPDQHINVWVQRDDDPASLRTGGRQSHLVDLGGTSSAPHGPLSHYGDALGFVRGYGSMNGVASSADVTRVAGSVGSTRRPCLYSGASGVTLAPDTSPEPWGAPTTLAAVADESLTLPGTRSIGARSGAGTRLAGTSGAAPAAARLMVINAAAGRPLTQGFGGTLALSRLEADTPLTTQKHSARVGIHTAAHVGKRM